MDEEDVLPEAVAAPLVVEFTEEEIEEGHAAFDTEDYQTGYRAFLQKTKPKFEGR